MKLLITPLAEADVNHILDHIAEHRPLTAVAVLGRIREKCELLVSQPEIGQPRPEFPGNYRSFSVQRWTIFYRVTTDAVEVHRVLDSSRDIDAIMGRR